jgi:hypothetical protein
MSLTQALKANLQARQERNRIGQRTYICHLSGGVTSWGAAKRLRLQKPDAPVLILFADTFIESEDTYRFLIHGAANIAGVQVPPCAYLPIPPMNLADPNPRRDALKSIAALAMRDIPGLHWIWDGRTPWEVFESVKFMGNSRVDPCSKLLKRELLDAWTASKFQPNECTHVVGLNWDEDDRITRLRERSLPRIFIAPLADKPQMSKAEVLEWAESEGLPISSAYKLGLAHDNCGGGCVKAGQGHWLQILHARPDVYAQWERQEKDFNQRRGKTYSMLKCRRGKTQKPLTLESLRLRDASGDVTSDEKLELGGCACALDV